MVKIKVYQIQKIVGENRDFDDRPEGECGDYYLYEFCINNGPWYKFDDGRKCYSVNSDELSLLGVKNVSNI